MENVTIKDLSNSIPSSLIELESSLIYLEGSRIQFDSS